MFATLRPGRVVLAMSSRSQNSGISWGQRPPDSHQARGQPGAWRSMEAIAEVVAPGAHPIYRERLLDMLPKTAVIRRRSGEIREDQSGILLTAIPASSNQQGIEPRTRRCGAIGAALQTAEAIRTIFEDSLADSRELDRSAITNHALSFAQAKRCA